MLSQVVLSFGIPFAVLPLIRLTSDRELMGGDVNHRVTTILGWAVGVLISLLNVVLDLADGDRLNAGPPASLLRIRVEPVRPADGATLSRRRAIRDRRCWPITTG